MTWFAWPPSHCRKCHKNTPTHQAGRLKKWNFPELFTWCVTHVRVMCFVLHIVLFVCVCNLNQEMSNVQETTDTLVLHTTYWHLRWYLLASTNSTKSTGQVNTGIQPDRTEKQLILSIQRTTLKMLIMLLSLIIYADTLCCAWRL